MSENPGDGAAERFGGEAAADVGDAEDLALSPDEATAVAEAALAFAAALPPERGEAYRELARSAADDGGVPAAAVPDLERVCVLALETGKARQLGRAEAEQLLSGVYRRTPGGRALQTEVADINRALQQVAGRRLDSVRLSWRMPGRYGLTLDVDGFELTLAIGPDGLSVQTLQTG